MEIPTKQNHVYTLTCENACEVYDVDTNRLIHEHHAGEVQSQFTAIGMKSRTSDDTAIVTEVFNGASVGNGAGGGYIESDLHVGHGAADAVAAVCTLALGDLAKGGTLADSNGQSVELESPHAYATGSVDIADATQPAALYFTAGEDEIEIDFPAAPQTEDHAEAAPIADFAERTKFIFDAYLGDSYVGGWYPTEPEAPPATLAELASLMNQEWSGQRVLQASVSGDKIVLTALSQYHGQQVSIRRADYDGFVFPFEGDEIILSGGTNARTPQDVVDILNASEDCPAVAVLDEGEQGITLTAKQYGVDYELSEDGSVFENPQDMTGGHGDYTVDELLEAIGGEFTDITAEEGAAEGTITLTANTAGAAANAVVFTATGCFGGGTTRQGSTVRGRNAVVQTDFEIVLNGNQPRALTPTTAMKNGGVYTVDAAYTATILSLPPNATAEIWVRIGATAFNVSLPDTWVWVNGAASDMTGKTNTTFCIAVRNDGVKVLASMAYSYETTPA